LLYNSKYDTDLRFASLQKFPFIWFIGLMKMRTLFL